MKVVRSLVLVLALTVTGFADEFLKFKQLYVKSIKTGKFSGNPDIKDAKKVVKIAKNKYALLFETFSPAQGFAIRFNDLYAMVDGKLTKVFSEIVGTDNEGFGRGKRTAWKATLSFDKTQFPYYDIVLHKKGIEKEEAIDEKIVFKFDGEKYVRSDNIVPTKRDKSPIKTSVLGKMISKPTPTLRNSLLGELVQ